MSPSFDGDKSRGLAADDGFSNERRISPCNVCSRTRLFSLPLRTMPSSAEIQTQVISVSWPVKIAAGDGFTSLESQNEIFASTRICSLCLTLIRIFTIDNSALGCIPNPDADSAITRAGRQKAISTHRCFRSIDTSNDVKMSIENLRNFRHVRIVNTKTFVPIASWYDVTVISCNNKALMFLLDSFVEMIAQMSSV